MNRNKTFDALRAISYESGSSKDSRLMRRIQVAACGETRSLICLHEVYLPVLGLVSRVVRPMPWRGSVLCTLIFSEYNEDKLWFDTGHYTTMRMAVQHAQETAQNMQYQ